MDTNSMNVPLTLNSLRQCGLPNFFFTANMQAQPRLLQTLVRHWDPEQGVFDLQDEILEITMEDIYFIIGLLRRGVAMILTNSGHGVGALSVQDYVNTYNVP